MRVCRYDRAATLGTGAVKCGGNYAADLVPAEAAKKAGYSVVLYLDAKTHTHVEEFSTSNFVGFSRDNKFVTPDSPSVLKSITNAALRLVAKDIGMQVEVRPLPFTEVASFKEVAACGTAVVLSQIQSCVCFLSSLLCSALLFSALLCSSLLLLCTGGSRVLTNAPVLFSITHPGGKIVYDECSSMIQKLRKAYCDIQTGDAPDNHKFLQDL